MIEARRFLGEVKHHTLRVMQLGLVAGSLALVLDGAAKADILPQDECSGQTVQSYFQAQADAEGVQPDGRTTLTQAALNQARPEDLSQCVVAPVEQAVPVAATSIPVGNLLLSTKSF